MIRGPASRVQLSRCAPVWSDTAGYGVVTAEKLPMRPSTGPHTHASGYLLLPGVTGAGSDVAVEAATDHTDVTGGGMAVQSSCQHLDFSVARPT